MKPNINPKNLVVRHNPKATKFYIGMKEGKAFLDYEARSTPLGVRGMRER